MSDARSRRAATAPAARWDPSPRDEPARWGPVLAGREQDEALTVATAIAAELTTWPTTGATLAGGSAGRALLHARFADDADQRDAGRTALRHAVGSLRTPGGPASLHLGAAGVGFVVAHLAGDLLDRRDRCGGVDRALTSLVDREPWTGLLDLMRGLVGIGVYALERLEVPAGPQLLARVVEHLDQGALRTPDGRTWWTPDEQLHDRSRRASPDGHVDLGVAHGVPGIVALLADACAADVATEVARPLLHDAVAWLLATSVHDDRELTSWWTPGQPNHAGTGCCCCHRRWADDPAGGAVAPVRYACERGHRRAPVRRGRCVHQPAHSRLPPRSRPR